MVNSVHPEQWKSLMCEEYLDTFVTDGGSVIRFVSPLEVVTKRDIVGALKSEGQLRRFLLFGTDARHTRVHFVNELLFSATRQIPFRELMREFVLGEASQCGFRVPAEDAIGVHDGLARAIAATNGIASQGVQLELRPRLQRTLLENPRLTREFAIAAMNLVLAELSERAEGEPRRTAALSWLQGTCRSVASLKPYQMYVRINRATARSVLESTAEFVRLCNRPGFVWLLDVASLGQQTTTDAIRYPKGSLLDAFEVLRQLIDSMDRMPGAAIIAFVSKDFMDEDAPRGARLYPALYNRLSDEVRHPLLGNPLNSFVRLSLEAEQVNR